MHGRNHIDLLWSNSKAWYIIICEARRISSRYIEVAQRKHSCISHVQLLQRVPATSSAPLQPAVRSGKATLNGAHSHNEPAGQSVLTRSIELEHGGAVYCLLRSLACDSLHCPLVNTAPSVANSQDGSWNVALLGQCHPHPVSCKKPPVLSCAAHVSTIPSTGASCLCDLPPTTLIVDPPLTEAMIL